MIIASKTAGAVKISIMGELTGETAWSYSDSAVLSAVLAEAAGARVELWVSSPGGSLDVGMAMRAQLEAYSGQIEIHTCGIVASAATLLLCLPNVVTYAHRGSVFMLHRARMRTEGSAEELRKDAGVLDVCDDELIKIYQLRIDRDAAQLQNMLEATTWLSSEDAVSLGLVTRVVENESEGFVAQPENVEPTRPAEPEEISEAVSARLTPRIQALETGLVTMSSNGEKRVKAITDAAEKAVSGIASASEAGADKIIQAGAQAVAGLRDELKAVQDELSSVREAYAKQAEKYKDLDEAISRAYGLCGGDLSFSKHDRQVKQEFKLDI